MSSGTDWRAVGERIRALRLARGLKQRELAERMREAGSDQKITNQHVSNWETAQHGIDDSRLVLLARVLGTTRSYLLDGVSTPDPDDDAPIPGLADMFPPGSPPTPSEIAWARRHPDFHRADLRAVYHAIMSMRHGLTPEQAAASREATERHRDPSVPRRR